jgi:hypothetical protein
LNDQINLCDYLDVRQCRIPARMRLRDDSTGYCSSLAILYELEDPRPGGAPIDIRSGGIIGWRALRQALGGVSQRTARRILAEPYGKSVQRVAGQPGTVICTATAIKALHEAAVAEERRRAGRKGGLARACPVSAGSGRLTNQFVETIVSCDDEPQPALWRVSGPRRARGAGSPCHE